MSARLFDVTSQSGPPVAYAGGSITPHAQAVKIALPIFNFRFTWNRPTAVTYQPQDGPAQTLPIIDKTRIIQIALLALGLFGALLIRRMYHD